jgi:hypothetical protein
MNNINNLFEFLERNNLGMNNFADEIIKWDMSKLITMSNEIYELIPFSGLESGKKKGNYSSSINLFDIIASGSLSGDTMPCAGTECRKRRVNELVNYSILYADHVSIKNPLRQLPSIATNSKELTDIKYEILITTFWILYKIKPLLDSGIMEIRDDIESLCPNCQKDAIEYIHKLEKATNIVLKEHLSDFEISVSDEPENKVVEIFGPEEFIESHGILIDMDKNKPINKEKILRGYFQRGLRSFVVPNWKNQSYITDREFDVSIMENSNGRATAKRSHEIAQGFSQRCSNG